ncbi:MAG: RidA family protein [Bryobacterales bacterium]|nr:RidA family protein [Bryobacterales bacterium]
MSSSTHQGHRRIHRPSSSQHKTAGPYSPVLIVNAGTLVAISGQGPLDAEGRIVGATIEEQTRLTLENCRRQLNAAGADFADVFKVTVYLKDMAEWDRFNTVYREHFREPFPARTAIQAVLWGGILVEVEMLAAPPERGRGA